MVTKYWEQTLNYQQEFRNNSKIPTAITAVVSGTDLATTEVQP